MKRKMCVAKREEQSCFNNNEILNCKVHKHGITLLQQKKRPFGVVSMPEYSGETDSWAEKTNAEATGRYWRDLGFDK